jgi:hypothetical protein
MTRFGCALRMAMAVAGLMLAVAVAPAVQAAPPVAATATVSGSSGAWVLDFSFTNNLGGTNDIYFVAVYDISGTLIGSPAGFPQWNMGATYNPAVYGGPNVNFNAVWIDNSATYTAFLPGTTVSGFQILDTSNDAPENLQWVVFAYGGQYFGGDNFYTTSSPGFTGTADIVEAPEPASLTLLGLGVATLSAAQRRRPR